MQPMPEHIAPMLASLGSGLPDTAGWAYEYKWDGVRAIVYHEPGKLRMLSRNNLDMARRYPELTAEAEKMLGDRRLVLDGEIVALDDNGRPSFQLLQRRMHVADSAAIARRAKSSPVLIMLFDLLYADGRSYLTEPWTARRQALEALAINAGRWQTPDAYQGRGAGKKLYAAAMKMDLEGIICKRADSLYIPGARSRDWVKVKVHQRQEVVIGGYLAMKSMGENTLGAMLVGYYENGELRYAGKVGTGFNNAERFRLVSLLKPLRRRTSPFVNKVRYADAMFVEPKLVAEVEFTEWTAGGALRHPSYKGLREDKPATKVVRERPAV